MLNRPSASPTFVFARDATDRARVQLRMQIDLDLHINVSDRNGAPRQAGSANRAMDGGAQRHAPQRQMKTSQRKRRCQLALA